MRLEISYEMQKIICGTGLFLEEFPINLFSEWDQLTQIFGIVLTLQSPLRQFGLRFRLVRFVRSLQEGTGHQGSKASKVLFLGDKNRIFTTGFSRMSERQYAIWDTVSQTHRFDYAESIAIALIQHKCNSLNFVLIYI